MVAPTGNNLTFKWLAGVLLGIVLVLIGWGARTQIERISVGEAIAKEHAAKIACLERDKISKTELQEELKPLVRMIRVVYNSHVPKDMRINGDEGGNLK